MTREAHANERTGYGSWAVATAADPAYNSSRYVAAVTNQSGGVGASVWVGSWDSSGTAWCTGTYVSTTALPSTVVTTNDVTAYSSPALTTNLNSGDMNLYVTVYTTSSTQGYLYTLANTGGDPCTGWTGSWTSVPTSSDVPISAPGATSFTYTSNGSTYNFDFVAVLVLINGSQGIDVISRANNGSWGTSQDTNTSWDSQLAVTSLLAVGNSQPQVYIFGTDGGTEVLNKYSTFIDDTSAAPTWSSITYNSFVNGDGLYDASEACSATGNSGASPESNNRIIVVCGDNSSPIHDWANIYPGTTYWAGTTAWYDQGAPSFDFNGTTEYATTRPTIGFFEGYGTTTNWMILGELDPFFSSWQWYTPFVESDYTTSWSSWAERYW